MSPALPGFFFGQQDRPIPAQQYALPSYFFKKNSILRRKSLKLSARIPLPETTAA
ncbi:hypothetical protein OU994_26375 [Pseudoduganella sp. SL102]|uniref:hypothetical protein n=1 Tax=Pseudoduganella sp. SL102 TaxID=2995154 RepID=UPI00248C1768|nr:hypothetical protein [Pseudoduganella sp. SL102]WBS01753.1 hypothetical protein OU994_26375 [Pseudoduganella sp. SL102]